MAPPAHIATLFLLNLNPRLFPTNPSSFAALPLLFCRFIVGKCLEAGRLNVGVFSHIRSSPISSPPSSLPCPTLTRSQFGALTEVHFWARNELVKHNLRLVKSLSNQYARRANTNRGGERTKESNLREEMYQEGILGLIRAAEKVRQKSEARGGGEQGWGKRLANTLDVVTSNARPSAYSLSLSPF